MESFILAAVEAGSESVYRLVTRTFLSAGSVAPVIRRLSERGLIRRDSRSKHNARSLSVTDKGRGMLEKCGVADHEIASIDFDNALRALWVARVHHPDSTALLVDNLAAIWEQRFAALDSAATSLKGKTNSATSLYVWLRAFGKARQSKAELDAIIALAANFGVARQQITAPVASEQVRAEYPSQPRPEETKNQGTSLSREEQFREAGLRTPRHRFGLSVDVE